MPVGSIARLHTEVSLHQSIAPRERVQFQKVPIVSGRSELRERDGVCYDTMSRLWLLVEEGLLRYLKVKAMEWLSQRLR